MEDTKLGALSHILYRIRANEKVTKSFTLKFVIAYIYIRCQTYFLPILLKLSITLSMSGSVPFGS